MFIINKKTIYLTIISLTALFLNNCAKFNTTEIGTSVITDFGNFNVKDTLIEVSAQTFIPIDTDRYILAGNANGQNINFAALGKIKDADFGTKIASVYFNLENPSGTTTPFTGSSIVLDSARLYLSVNSYYGDTVNNFNFNLYRLTQIPKNYSTGYYFYSDKLNYNNTPISNFVSNYKTLTDTSFKFQRKLIFNLDNTFGNSFINAPSTTWSSADNFKNFFNGFAVVPDANYNSNIVLNSNLVDTGTYLSIFYKSIDAGNTVATQKIIKFGLGLNCGLANNITWDKLGSFNNYLNNPSKNEDFIFIQSNYGIMANVLGNNIKKLPSNIIVHKAELVLKEIAPTLTNSTKLSPNILFLLIDSSVNKYGGIPKDYSALTYFSNQLNYLQGTRIDTVDNNNKHIGMYKFNISRYVQNIINNKATLFPFVILSDNFAPFYNDNTVYTQTMNGQAKFVGGSNGATNIKDKMHIRIIYSISK